MSGRSFPKRIDCEAHDVPGHPRQLFEFDDGCVMDVRVCEISLNQRGRIRAAGEWDTPRDGSDRKRWSRLIGKELRELQVHDPRTRRVTTVDAQVVKASVPNALFPGDDPLWDYPTLDPKVPLGGPDTAMLEVVW